MKYSIIIVFLIFVLTLNLRNHYDCNNIFSLRRYNKTVLKMLFEMRKTNELLEEIEYEKRQIQLKMKQDNYNLKMSFI